MGAVNVRRITCVVVMIAAAPCFALPPACSMPCRAATLASVLPLVLRALCRLPS